MPAASVISGMISGQTCAPSQDAVRRIIESYLDIIPNYDAVQVAFFGGSFTGIPEAVRRQYLETAASYVKNKQIDSIRISTRPDYIDSEILAMLKEYSVRTIELGAQSMDDEVLRRAGRGHTAADTVRASERIRAWNFELGLQTMTCLPGASYESDRKTAEEIIRLHPDFVRIYPTVVIKGTPLHTMYIRGEYIAPPLDKTVALCGINGKISIGKYKSHTDGHSVLRRSQCWRGNRRWTVSSGVRSAGSLADRI